jgi:hypothetical protein
VHPETILEILQVLVDHPERVFDPFQDLLPRGRGDTIGGFQFFDLGLEAAPPLSAQLPSRSHSPIHDFPNSLFDQLYLPGRSSSLPVAATSFRRNPGGPSATPGGFPMSVSAKISMPPARRAPSEVPGNDPGELESLKTIFEVEQPTQGVAAAVRIKSPDRSAVVDLQEFNQR